MKNKIKRIFFKILSNMFLSSKSRKAFRRKYVNNFVIIKGDVKHNNISIPKHKNIKLNINGKNNTIEIDDNIDDQSKIQIIINGDNNYIKIGSANINASIRIGYPDHRITHGAKFICGTGIMNGLKVLLLEDNTTINIGEDCMFAHDIEFRCTDDHTVLDDTGNVLNLAKSIEIGNHVWIGMGSVILKNTKIPNGCIIGAKSVVAGKKFTESNCAICGNPARIVKEKVRWLETRPDFYNKGKTNEKQGIIS